MVAVFGDVKPEDEYTHPLGPEPNFNESMYFNFFDRAHETGGFVRMGNRANERNADGTFCLYLPHWSLLFNYKRPGRTPTSASAWAWSAKQSAPSTEPQEPVARQRARTRSSAVLTTNSTCGPRARSPSMAKRCRSMGWASGTSPGAPATGRRCATTAGS